MPSLAAVVSTVLQGNGSVAGSDHSKSVDSTTPDSKVGESKGKKRTAAETGYAATTALTPPTSGAAKRTRRKGPFQPTEPLELDVPEVPHDEAPESKCRRALLCPFPLCSPS